MTYTLTPDGELWIEMESTTDTPTLVNLVHHTYWNIAGQATNSIENHTLQAHADWYLPLDRVVFQQGLFVTLMALPLTFGFLKAQSNLGQVIRLTPSPEGAGKGGVDHCLIINNWKPDGALRPAVTLTDPASGEALKFLQTNPAFRYTQAIILTHHSQGKMGLPIDNMQRSASRLNAFRTR